MRDKRTGTIVGRQHIVLSMIADGLTAVQIANELDVNNETIRKFARKRGLRIKRVNQSMENHPSWNGGETRDRTGYILRRVSVSGPYGYLIRALAKRGKSGSDPAGYAPVHRIVMHDLLGRPLTKGEVVDHIDGNIENNDGSNLRVFASNADHLRETLKGRVPQWTPDGWERMQASNRAIAKRRESTPGESRTCDRTLPLSFL